MLLFLSPICMIRPLTIHCFTIIANILEYTSFSDADSHCRPRPGLMWPTVLWKTPSNVFTWPTLNSKSRLYPLDRVKAQIWIALVFFFSVLFVHLLWSCVKVDIVTPSSGSDDAPFILVAVCSYLKKATWQKYLCGKAICIFPVGKCTKYRDSDFLCSNFHTTLVTELWIDQYTIISKRGWYWQEPTVVSNQQWWKTRE